jgi:hypothetical protein
MGYKKYRRISLLTKDKIIKEQKMRISIGKSKFRFSNGYLHFNRET